jgi:hypothetical protein
VEFGDVLVLQTLEEGLGDVCGEGVLGVVGGEDAHVLHHDLVGLAAETVDLEAAHAQHLVQTLPVLDRHQVRQ